MLDVSINTVVSWRMKGLSHKKSKGKVTFDTDEVSEWLHARKSRGKDAEQFNRAKTALMVYQAKLAEARGSVRIFDPKKRG